MPALKNGEHNLYNGRVVDKESEDVVYFDDTHEYIDKESGNKGISVTTLIHNYTNPFDADFWASYKALESLMDMDTWLILKKTLLSRKKFDSRYLTKFNIDEEEFLTKKAEILKSYDTTREESCKRGTEIHSILEQALYRKDPSISKYQFGGNLDVYEGNYSKELKDGVYPEYLVSYKFNDLIICGQIDLLIIENGEIIVVDHKTNGKLEMKSYYDRNKKSNVMMKYPLNNVMDCNGMHYALQLSLYAWMIKQIKPEYEVKRLTLHWIDHDNNESYIDVPYMENEVRSMLRHYYKQLKIKKDLDKIKPVIE